MLRVKAVLMAAFAVLAVAVAPQAHAYLFAVCPSGLSGIATTVTSCPFADNVRAAFFASPSTRITAYSPVTGGVYYMSCYPNMTVTLNTGTRLAVECDGGNDAVVVFW